jgi:hypothetical protein
MRWYLRARIWRTWKVSVAPRGEEKGETHLVLHLLHRSRVTLTDGTLMVTEDGDETVGAVVSEDFVGNRGVLRGVLELLNERP